MSLIHALILGMVQGVTEFLPISSDGHLVVVQKLLKFDQPPVFFDVLVHLATLLSIIIFFRREILHLNRHTLKLIIIATLPTGVIGLFLNQYINTLFNSLGWAAAGFATTGMLLLSLKLIHSHPHQPFTPLKAFLVGMAQGLAVLPGVSRSGSTIVVASWLGAGQLPAFTFSFLISLPAIIGAQLVQFKTMPQLDSGLVSNYALGFAAAAAVGLISLRILKQVITTKHLHRFAYYTLPLSIFVWWLSKVSSA